MLRELRSQAGLTQEYPANQLGVSRPQYHKLETGKAELKLNDIRVIAELYEISPDEIIQGRLKRPEQSEMEANLSLGQILSCDLLPRGIKPQTNPEKLKNVLLYVLRRLAGMSASELSVLSRKDMPWIAAAPGELINYQHAMCRADEASVRETSDDL